MATIYDIETVGIMLNEIGKTGRRVERDKWLPLYEAVKELLSLGESLVEQEPVFMKIEAAIEELKKQGED